MEVQCRFYMFGAISWFTDAYTCEVTSISKIIPGSEIKSFIGTHQQGKSGNDVKYLLIFDQNIQFFPRSLQTWFPNLTYLRIAGCGIKKISKEDFIGLEDLECLDLSSNQLTELPDNLFADMKKLERIFFYKNNLERLSSKLLEPIGYTLKIADFTDNVRINDCFDKNVTGKNYLENFKKAIDAACLPPEHLPNFKETAACNCNNELLTKFAEFRVSGEYTDFTIKVCGTEFKVHKCILAAQSTVFHGLFSGDANEASKSFTNIKNLSEKVFGSFLSYFYSGDFESAEAMELFELASQFDVPKLKEKSIARILLNIDESNALEIFNVGYRHNSDDLKQAAFKVIQKMCPELKDHFAGNLEKVNSFFALREEMNKILKE